MAKYPNSTLIKYIGPVYVQVCNGYARVQELPQAIDYADRDRRPGRQSGCHRSVAGHPAPDSGLFRASFKGTAPDANAQLTKERDAAAKAVKLLAKLPKPEKMTDEQFDAQKNRSPRFSTARRGLADFQLKDYPGTVAAYKAVLANTPTDAVADYRLGARLPGNDAAAIARRLLGSGARYQPEDSR